MRVVATAGHVDHGKSTLVHALTGTDPDRFDEEKRRGMTIDLGFAHMVLPSGEGLAFVDVPGHVRFLRNMLAGVGGVDACLFVVAATEGWKPQSEEHLRILELLGLTHGVVALTKVDAVDDEWAELARLDVTDHVAGTFLQQAPIVPVAATTGQGLDELRAALDVLVTATPAATDRGRPRLWVDRVFAAKGSGTVVTGTLTGGGVSVGDLLVVEPSSRPVRVRAVQSLGTAVESIGPGNRVALNLVGVERGEVRRGDAVVRPGQWRPTTRFDAELRVLGSLEHPVARRGAHVAYLGSGAHPARLRVLGIHELAPGSRGAVRVHLGTPVPLVPGDRFILRESGRQETVGGGEVLDVAPRLPASRAHPDRSVERVIDEWGWIPASDLEVLTGERRAPTVGRWLASPGALAAMEGDVADRVADAGSLGLDLAVLDEREREVVARLAGVVVDGGRVRAAGAVDPLLDHPFLPALDAGGFAPPPPDGVDRGELREMVRRGLAVERDGVVFAAGAVDRAAALAARLLVDQPDGFTVADFRDAAGITRKHALPLLAELDARAVTRRRDDLRVAGPRLPQP